MLPQNIHYENGPMGNLLIWILDGEASVIQYQFQLITRQPLAYLLPCLIRYRSGSPQLCQDIGDLVPLDQMHQLTALCPEIGRQVLRSIGHALLDAEDRLLPCRQFTIHPSFIFLTSDLQIKLAFWPVKLLGKASLDPGGCAGQIGVDSVVSHWREEMDRLVRALGAACRFSGDAIADISQCLSEKGIAGMLSYLDLPAGPEGLAGPAAPSVLANEPHIRTDARKAARRTLLKGLTHLWDSCSHALSNSGIKHWFDCLINGPEDDISGQEYQTVLLTADPADFRMALLAEGRPGTPEEAEGLRAFILVDEFLIGRDTKNIDLCLPDPGIGRQHVRIVRRAGSFFINDLGSRNGTRLDGRRLPKNTETLLPDQCILQFADRSFYFQVEGS
jgi:hypothetical protein